MSRQSPSFPPHKSPGYHDTYMFSDNHCFETHPNIVGEGNGTPLQYSCLENPMDGGAWWAAVHGVMKSQTWLSAFTVTFHFHAWEKEMATHFSVLAWRIPGSGEPGGLPSMGSHRVGQDWSDLAAAAAAYVVFYFHFLYEVLDQAHNWRSIVLQSLGLYCEGRKEHCLPLFKPQPQDVSMISS